MQEHGSQEQHQPSNANDVSVIIADEVYDIVDADEVAANGEEQHDTAGRTSTEEEGGTPGRRTCAKAIILPAEVERDLGEWMQAHPLLYDRSLVDYKNTNKKRRVMEEKAVEIGLTYEKLARWLHSMRTRYGRLTKAAEKSGTGAAKGRTERDAWILQLFSFMKAHIIRQKQPKNLGVKQVCSVKNHKFLFEMGVSWIDTVYRISREWLICVAFHMKLK